MGASDSILAAYNAGEGTVLAYLNGRPLYLANKTINPGSKRTAGGVPPYPETIAYVSRGLRVYRWLERRDQFPSQRDQDVPKRWAVPNREGVSVDSAALISQTRRSSLPSNLPGNNRRDRTPATELVYYDPRTGHRSLIRPGSPATRIVQPGPVIVSPETRGGGSGNAADNGGGSSGSEETCSRIFAKTVNC